MPFSQLQRRDSWPPTIIRIDPDESAHEILLDDPYDPIDADPSSHFLTPPDDIEDPFDADFEDLTAGIESPTAPIDIPVRAVSPSSLEQILEEEDAFGGIKMPLALRDFTKLHSSRRVKGKGAQLVDEIGMGLALSFPPPNMGIRGQSRGRATIKQITPRGKVRGQTRSLPGRRRAHSWQEPSPNVYSILEERELEIGVETSNSQHDRSMGHITLVESVPKRAMSEMACGKSPEKKQKREVGCEDSSIAQSSLPSPSASPVAVQSPTIRPKKRVRWAL